MSVGGIEVDAEIADVVVGAALSTGWVDPAIAVAPGAMAGVVGVDGAEAREARTSSVPAGGVVGETVALDSGAPATWWSSLWPHINAVQSTAGMAAIAIAPTGRSPPRRASWTESDM